MMNFIIILLTLTSVFSLPVEYDERDVAIIAPGSVQAHTFYTEIPTRIQLDNSSSTSITSLPGDSTPTVVVSVSTATPTMPTLTLDGIPSPTSTSISRPVVSTEYGNWIGQTNSIGVG